MTVDNETTADFVRLADQSASWVRTLVRDGQQELDHAGLIELLGPSLANARDRQSRGDFPADVDTGIVTLMFFAATSASATLPHVTRALSPIAPTDPDFVDFYADQLGRLIRHLGQSGNG